MIALIKDKEDQALRVIQLTEMGYDVENQQLWLSSPDNDYIIDNIYKFNADELIKILYSQGKIDLSMFSASLDYSDY